MANEKKKKKKKSSGSASTIVLFVIFFAGLGLLSYPTISDYYNSFHQSRAIATYQESISNLGNDVYEEIFEEARAYNAALLERPFSLVLKDYERAVYNKVLDPTDSGVMGYIEIPVIRVSLPIYHGTDESVLQIGVGHLEGTTLPIGGENTHCVLSGHRGLPSAKLLTDMDKLVEGDTFIIRTLDETYTYQIDQIRIVLPSEVEDLMVVPNRDLCTLITCTPYGVNTHRMLVRGTRVANAENSDIRVPNDALRIDPVMVAPAVAVPILFGLLLALIVATGKKKKR